MIGPSQQEDDSKNKKRKRNVSSQNLSQPTSSSSSSMANDQLFCNNDNIQMMMTNRLSGNQQQQQQQQLYNNDPNVMTNMSTGTPGYMMIIGDQNQMPLTSSSSSSSNNIVTDTNNNNNNEDSNKIIYNTKRASKSTNNTNSLLSIILKSKTEKRYLSLIKNLPPDVMENIFSYVPYMARFYNDLIKVLHKEKECYNSVPLLANNPQYSTVKSTIMYDGFGHRYLELSNISNDEERVRYYRYLEEMTNSYFLNNNNNNNNNGRQAKINPFIKETVLTKCTKVNVQNLFNPDTFIVKNFYGKKTKEQRTFFVQYIYGMKIKEGIDITSLFFEHLCVNNSSQSRISPFGQHCKYLKSDDTNVYNSLESHIAPVVEDLDIKLNDSIETLKDFTSFSHLRNLKIKSLTYFYQFDNDSMDSCTKLLFNNHMRRLTLDGYDIFLDRNRDSASNLKYLKTIVVDRQELKWIADHCTGLESLYIKITGTNMDMIEHLEMLLNRLKEITITCKEQFFNNAIVLMLLDNNNLLDKIKKINLTDIDMNKVSSIVMNLLSNKIERIDIAKYFNDEEKALNYNYLFNNLKKVKIFRYIHLPSMPNLEKLKVNGWDCKMIESEEHIYDKNHFPKLKILTINESALFYFQNCERIGKFIYFYFLLSSK